MSQTKQAASPLVKARAQRALKRKKNKEEDGETKKVVEEPSIFDRTCFICINRYPQELSQIHREIDAVKHSIRVCPSCQLGMTKFLPIRADHFIESVIE